MRSRSVIEVGLDDRGRTVMRRNYNEPAVLARSVPAPDGSLTVWLVAGAAGPIGGDEFTVEVTARAGSTVTVRSVAATVALPGPGGEWSSARLDLVAEPKARLVWCGATLVVAAGCQHRSTTTVRAASGSVVAASDNVVLGRSGEQAGLAVLRQRVFDDEDLVLDHENHLGSGTYVSAGANGSYRHHLTELAVGGGEAAGVRAGVQPHWVAGRFPVGDRAALITVSGSCPASLVAGRQWLDAGSQPVDVANSPTAGNRGETRDS